jgi:phage terminase small subunit
MTPKQEAFARAYVETGNASEAYRRSYNAGNMEDNVIAVKACELLKNGKVAVMVQQLKDKHQKRHEITVDKLTEMALAAFKEAQRIAPTSGQMQTSSMVKAAEFLGKLHGLIVDRSEVTHKDGVEDLTEAELANIARSGRRGTVAPAGGSSQSH